MSNFDQGEQETKMEMQNLDLHQWNYKNYKGILQDVSFGSSDLKVSVCFGDVPPLGMCFMLHMGK